MEATSLKDQKAFWEAIKCCKNREGLGVKRGTQVLESDWVATSMPSQQPKNGAQ